MATVYIRAPVDKIAAWLASNVGDYYGKSIDGMFGQGWRMSIQAEDLQTVISEPLVLWRVEIDNEELALICRLSW